jgi:hypothetical protein
MSWIYTGVEFTEDNIPEGAVGFIYQMTAIINDKAVMYIGKKNFYANRKIKLGKRATLALQDKRLKKYKQVSKLDYHKYYSSNDILKAASKADIKIKREILMICFSATELTYQEAKYLFCNDVLDNPLYLNSNILGKFFRSK